MTTTIQVSDKLWKELIRRKSRGQTFEDIIWKAISGSAGDSAKKEVKQNGTKS
jgi:predicted CopG family antitoxin